MEVDCMGFVDTELFPRHLPTEARWVQTLFFICVPLPFGSSNCEAKPRGCLTS